MFHLDFSGESTMTANVFSKRCTVHTYYVDIAVTSCGNAVLFIDVSIGNPITQLKLSITIAGVALKPYKKRYAYSLDVL